MKPASLILSFALGALTALSGNASAQTNAITVTNVITVTVTNIVTVTNTLPNADTVTASNQVVGPPRYPWENSISLGLTLTEGNGNTLLTTAAFKTRKKTPANEFGFGIDGAYGESDSVQNDETLHGITQYNHLFDDRLYGYLNAEGLHDGIAHLQYRFTTGPGVGYYFLRETNASLAGEFGPSFVTQQLGGEDTTYASLRLAERFEHKLRSSARIWEKAEILPQVDKFQNYLVNAEAGAEASITKTLLLRATVVDNFINQPAAGRRKNDLKIISGLVYRF